MGIFFATIGWLVVLFILVVGTLSIISFLSRKRKEQRKEDQTEDIDIEDCDNGC